MESIRLSAPLSVELTLTKGCNHKCLHCYNPWRKSNNTIGNKLTIEQIDKIVDELAKNNVWHVTISGGEPLTMPNEMFHLIRQLDKNGITYSINSNLTLMTEEIADFLKEKLKLKTLILTSLPSINEKKCDEITQIDGSYQRILKGISISKQHGFKIGINIVITKKNIDDLDNILEFLKEFKIDYLSISTVIPPSYDILNKDYYLTNEDIVRVADCLLEVHKKLGIDVDSVTPLPLCILGDANKYQNVISTSCSAGINRCDIDCNGDIFACSHENTPYGNIFVEGLKKSWDKMDMWRHFQNINKECIDCNYMDICGGECRMITNTKIPQLYSLNKNKKINYSQEFNSIKIMENDKFTINNNIKLRKENFGAVLRIDYDDFFLSENMLQLYSVMKELEEFSIQDLQEFVEINENFYNIIDYMVKIGLLNQKSELLETIS